MRNGTGVSKRLAAAGFRKKERSFFLYLFHPTQMREHLPKGFEGFWGTFTKVSQGLALSPFAEVVSAEKQRLLQKSLKGPAFLPRNLRECLYFLHASHRMEGKKKGPRRRPGDRRGGESPGAAHRHALSQKGGGHNLEI